MNARAIARCAIFAAGLWCAGGCETIAPLQPLQSHDSGPDGTGDLTVDTTDAVESGDLPGDSNDVGQTIDVAPDSGDGGVVDVVPDVEDDGGSDTRDASDDVSDLAGGGDAGDAAEDGTTDGGDAGGPAIVTCDPSLPFGDAIPVYGLNRQPGKEFQFHVSPDELTAYVSAGDAWWVGDLFVSQRSSKSEPFGPLMPLTTLNTEFFEGSIVVTPDGLTAVFDSDRDRQRTGARIFMATRATPTGSFGTPNEVVIRGGLIDEYDPYVLPDSSALYFRLNAQDGIGIYRVPLAGMNAGSATPVLLGLDDRYPVVTADELTIYFTANDSVGSTWGDIWTMTRTSRDMPFSSPTSLSELNTQDIEIPQSLSPDGCRLYFTRTFASAGGVSYSFVAERVRRPPDAGALD